MPGISFSSWRQPRKLKNDVENGGPRSAFLPLAHRWSHMTRRKLRQCLMSVESWATPDLPKGTEIHPCRKPLVVITKPPWRFSGLFRGIVFAEIAKSICPVFLLNSLALGFFFFFSGDNNGWSLQFDKYFSDIYKLTPRPPSECCK